MGLNKFHTAPEMGMSLLQLVECQATRSWPLSMILQCEMQLTIE